MSDPAITPATPSSPSSTDSGMLQSLSDHPNFQVSWTNRRRIINRSLGFCGSVVMLIIIMCGASMLLNRDVQANITSIFITIISSVVFFSLAVIGSYVFGTTWETNNFRDKLTDIATTIVKH